MCDCIREFEKTFTSTLIDKRVVEKAEVVTVGIMFSTGKTQTISEMEVVLAGRKSKVKKNLLHTYCPFCGVKY